MSIARAVEFIKCVDFDSALQAKVKALSPTDPVGLVLLGRAAGYYFCAAEFKAAAESLGRFAGELSEAELDHVAGRHGSGCDAVMPISNPHMTLVQMVKYGVNFGQAFRFRDEIGVTMG